MYGLSGASILIAEGSALKYDAMACWLIGEQFEIGVSRLDVDDFCGALL
jgi:hypothetical protein